LFVVKLVVLWLSVDFVQADTWLQSTDEAWQSNELSGVEVEPRSGGVTLGRGTGPTDRQGTVVGVPLELSNTLVLESLEWEQDQPEGTQIRVTLQGRRKGSDVWVDVLQAKGYRSGNEEWFELTKHDFADYSAVRLRAQLSSEAGRQTPVLIEWRLRYRDTAKPQQVHDFETETDLADTSRLSEERAHGGTRSLVFTGGGRVKTKRIPIRPGEHVGLDFWVYFEQGNAPGTFDAYVHGYADSAAPDEKWKCSVGYGLKSPGRWSVGDYYRSTPLMPAGVHWPGNTTFDKLRFPTPVGVQTPTGMWYHFTGRSAKTDTNNWWGRGETFAPETWDRSNIKEIAVELRSSGGKTFVDDLVITRDGPLAPEKRSLSDLDKTRIYKKPAWRHRYDALEEKLTRIKQERNLDTNPAYRTVVIENDATITLTREVYSLVFAKSKACVSSATVRGRKLDGLVLPELVIVDDKGGIYSQANTTDGSLSHFMTPRLVVLKGSFTPLTAQGAKLPSHVDIRYEMNRMSGYVEVFMTLADAGIDATYLTVKYSLGNPRPRLKYANVYNRYSGKGKYRWPWGGTDTKSPFYLVEDDRETIVQSGKYPVAGWYNGIYGFQAFLSDQDDSGIDEQFESDTDDRLLTALVDGQGNRIVQYTPIHRSRPLRLGRGHRVATAFSMLPYKKFRPLGYANGSGIWVEPRLPSLTAPAATAKFTEAFRKMAEEGINMINWDVAFNLEHWPGLPSLEVRRLYVDIAHKFGIRVLGYMETAWTQQSGHTGMESGHTPIELQGLLQRHAEYHEMWNNPYYGVVHTCYNFDDARLSTLTLLEQTLEQLPEIDGIYLDSNMLRSCGHVEHGCVAAGSTTARGHLRFLEDMRTLLDYYSEINGKPYYLVGQTWAELTNPTVALVDFTLPGEQIGGPQALGQARRVKSLLTMESIDKEQGVGYPQAPGAPYFFAYNAPLSGVQPIFYSDNSYQLDQMQLWHEALAGALSPYVNSWPNSTMEQSGGRKLTESERLLLNRFQMPLIVFDVTGAEFHHYTDFGYDRIVDQRGGGQSLVYRKEDRLLFVLTNIHGDATAVDCGLDLSRFGIVGAEMLIYDVTNEVASSTRVIGNKLSLNGIDVSIEPRLFLIQPQREPPAVLWNTVSVWGSKVSWQATQRTLEIEVHGVPNSQGEFLLYASKYGEPRSVEGCVAKEKGSNDGLIWYEVAFPDSGITHATVRW